MENETLIYILNQHGIDVLSEVVLDAIDREYDIGYDNGYSRGWDDCYDTYMNED